MSDAAARSAQNVSDAAARSAQNLSDSVQALQNATLDLAEAVQDMVIAANMWIASTALQMFALRVAEHEDMNIVDGYERHRMGVQVEGSFFTKIVRRNKTEASNNTVQEQAKEVKVEKDLPVISPVIDGRLKDLNGKAGVA